MHVAKAVFCISRLSSFFEKHIRWTFVILAYSLVFAALEKGKYEEKVDKQAQERRTQMCWTVKNRKGKRAGKKQQQIQATEKQESRTAGNKKDIKKKSQHKCRKENKNKLAKNQRNT